MRVFVLFALLTSAASAQPTPRSNPDAPATAYVGGQWWDGERFFARDTAWVASGLFLSGPLADAERVVELDDE